MTGEFVIDASMTLSWLIDSEATPFTEGVLEMLRRKRGVTPALWAFEVSNALTLAERRWRIRREELAQILERLENLRVEIEQRPLLWLCQQILPIARRYGLTAYDAAYLELAIREELPLATLDDKLRQAAVSAGVPLVEAAA